MSKTIKNQRDHFLAFSFASADLLIEVGSNEKIIFATGAAMGITGIDDQNLCGKHWLQLFSRKEHSKLIKLQDKKGVASRRGPISVQLSKEIGKSRMAILTAIKMPDNKNFYITLALKGLEKHSAAGLVEEIKQEALVTDFDPNEENAAPLETDFETGPEKEAALETDFEPEEKPVETLQTDFEPEETPTEPLETNFEQEESKPEAPETDFEPEEPASEEIEPDPPEETKEPEEIIEEPENKEEEQEEESLSELNYIMRDKYRYVDESFRVFNAANKDNITAVITILEIEKPEDIDYEAWGPIEQKIENYLGEKSINNMAAAKFSETCYCITHSSDIKPQDIEERIKEFVTDSAINIPHATITADLDKFSPKEASRAMHYVSNAIEDETTNISITGLFDGFNELVTNNTEKISTLKSIIERVDFDLKFQPVVDIDTRILHHYEVFTRFKTGTTKDWTMFCEDIGIIADFDVSVVQRVMNHIHYKAGTTRHRFSINMSCKSLKDENFYENLFETLEKRDLASRLIFELTDSNVIENVFEIADCITRLNSHGYEVILDDFGGSDEELDRLKRLDINYLKLDGTYTTAITEDEENEDRVKSLIQDCAEHDMTLIASRIETPEQVEKLKQIGIQLGQGYFLGEPSSQTDYVPPVT